MDCSPDSQRKKSDWCLFLGIPLQFDFCLYHLIPDQLTENGLSECKPEFPDKILEKIITDYTQEAGIRGLNREIGKVFRKMARIALQDPNKVAETILDESDITNFLGPTRFRREAAEGANTVGVVTSLVWTRYG